MVLIGGTIGGGNRGGNPLSTLPEEQWRICEMFVENPKISIRRIAERLGIRPRTVEKQVDALKDKGILLRKGGPRGFWKVNVVH